jgi:hypothetical protein
MPAPGTLDDLFEVGVLRIPTEHGFCLCGIGDKRSAVAGAAGLTFCRNFMTGYFAADIDDFLYSIAVAIAEVEGAGDAGLERKDMCLGEVLDVDVVAHAGAVAGFVILAEDKDFFALALGDLQEKMSFLHLASTIAVMRLSDPLTLFSKNGMGAFIDSPTSM